MRKTVQSLLVFAIAPAGFAWDCSPEPKLPPGGDKPGTSASSTGSAGQTSMPGGGTKGSGDDTTQSTTPSGSVSDTTQSTSPSGSVSDTTSTSSGVPTGSGPVQDCKGMPCGTRCQRPADVEPNGKKTHCNLQGQCVNTGPTCDQQCYPGEVYEDVDGCNTCTCPASGNRALAACTEAGCGRCTQNSDCGTLSLCNDGRDACSMASKGGSCLYIGALSPNSVARPVCGCDGKRYPSEHAAHEAKTDVSKYGGCPAPDSEDRVCGTTTCGANNYCELTSYNEKLPSFPEYFSKCHRIPDACRDDQTCTCLQKHGLATDCIDVGGLPIARVRHGFPAD